MDKNQHALALAFKKAKAKSNKIKELNIHSDMTEQEIEDMIVMQAKAKAETAGDEWTTHIKGMRWYVESLVKFSGLSAKERLEVEYEDAFAEVASEAEMLAKLEDLV